MIAAAKYGIKLNDPRADFGITKPRNSDATANAQSNSASLNSDRGKLGALAYAKAPPARASTVMKATYSFAIRGIRKLDPLLLVSPN